MRFLFVWVLCMVLAGEGVMAQSQIRVTLSDRSRITVAVDGRYFNRRGTAITVGDLPPGRHSLKIYSVQYDRWGSPYERVIFQGRVTTEYRMITNVVYNPYTRMARVRQMSEDFMVGASADDERAAYQDGVDEETSMPTSPSSASAQPAGAVASPAPMGSLSFDKQEALKKKCDAEKTDTKKLTTVKSGLAGETVSTTQIMEMMDWFLFESTRLEFAKWAYSIALDKQSYRDLSSRFETPANKQEFDAFVKRQH